MIDISILKMKLFFFFRNYYSIFPAPLPMTDRYISIVNHHLLIMIIFIPATLKYFSSIILVLIKHYSCIQHYPILLTILPNCVGPILPPATFQQCRRLNFCKENLTELHIIVRTTGFTINIHICIFY